MTGVVFHPYRALSRTNEHNFKRLLKIENKLLVFGWCVAIKHFREPESHC